MSRFIDPEPAKDPIIKTCGCGRSYTASQWAALEYHATHKWPWGEVQEYRHCLCHSTIVVVLEEGDQESDLWMLEEPV